VKQTRWVSCPACADTGKRLVDGEWIVCERCKGSGVVKTDKPRRSLYWTPYDVRSDWSWW